jgi:hypothetical protein
MKIYNIRDKNGQASFKGNVIHFAQQIEEVSDVLPRNMNDIDVIIVNESLKNIDKVNQLLVRPHYILEALNWLIVHNCLYNNVKKINTNIKQYDLTQIIINGIKKFQKTNPCEAEGIQHTLNLANDQLTQMSNNQTLNQSIDSQLLSPIINLNEYVAINPRIAILRSDYNQGMLLFSNETRGQQCTAISAYAIASTFFTPINEWTIDIINDIILSGDMYYSICQERLAHQLHPFNRYLDVQEVLGTININNTEITLQYWSNDIFNDSRQGIINKNNLNNTFNEFLAHSARHAFFICNDFTMAIIKYRNSLYLFDSHSKTPTGRRTEADKGRGSCMLFKNPNAASELSSYFCKICTRNATFSITYVAVLTIEEIIDNNNNSANNIEMNRNTSKII